jgi:hypothetical protein
MASFGKVLDLLEDGYLEKVQDVIGNVEPLPTLVPYDKYAQNVIVYRMDTTHEVFLGMLHDFTARMSQQLGKELWTWCVQWDVDYPSESAPSPKKPRLGAEHTEDDRDEQQMKASKPIIDIFDRCVLDPELVQQEEMLRILINVVQAESSVVPNVIEFMYRWIDFFEGDGTALKAALKWEIPSLWDFDYHPLVVTGDMMKKKLADTKVRVEKEKAAIKTSEQNVPGSKAIEPSILEELVHGFPTKKMRKKPVLAIMEHLIEENDRLKYREVKYGIQPPKTDRPMPPLINIPLEPLKRVKYYNACFRSRHRALVLLLEAGITLPQVSNYVKGQNEHPRDTSEDGGTKDARGLRHYHKDAEAAQYFFKIKEKSKSQNEKQNEISMSNKLAVEAQRAAATTATEGNLPAPLIPFTPAYNPHPDMAADMWSRIQAARGKGEECINFVPMPLVGGMKSKFLRNARDRQQMLGAGRPDPIPAARVPPYRAGDDEESQSEDDDGSGSGSDADDDSNDDNDGEETSGNPMLSSTQSAIPAQPFLPPTPVGPVPVAGQSQNRYPVGLVAPEANTPQPPPSPVAMLDYMRNMTPEHARRIFLMLNPRVQQGVANMMASQVAINQVSRLPTGYGVPSMNSTTIASTPVGGLQPTRGALMAFLSPPVRPLMPGPRLTTLPALPAQHPVPDYAVPPAAGVSGHHFSQPKMNYQTFKGPVAPSYPIPTSQTAYPPANGTSVSSSGLRALLGPPQISRPQQVTPSTPSMPRLPLLPPLPAAPHPIGPATTMAPPFGMQGGEQVASGPQQSPYINSTLPLSSPGRSFNLDQFRMLQRQQVAQAQGPHQQHHNALRTNNVSSGQPFGRQQPQHPSTGRNNVQNQFQPPSGPAAFIPPLPQPTPLIIAMTAHSYQTPCPDTSSLSAPLSGIHRNAPSPLTLAPPTSKPLSSLASSILATTPFRSSAASVPIQIYFPKIVLPANGIGPGGTRLGDNNFIETDAFLLGHTMPGSGKIVSERALFMPLGCWTNCLNRVRKGHYQVLETYMSPFNSFTGKPTGKDVPCHAAAYSKLAQAYNLMKTTSPAVREEELTKRWRASQGPMTQRDRGAVWEGWGVTLDREIVMSKGEREGVMVSLRVVDDGVDRLRTEEEEERWREMERLMEEDGDEDMEE